MLSRRALLFSSAAWLGCRARKATGYPGYCFVANQDDSSLSVVDLSDFRTWRPIPLPANPTALVAHPRRPKVFALAAAAGALFEIDVASLTVTRRVRAGNRALSMRLAPDGGSLWVLYREPAALVEFPLEDFAPRRSIALAAPPDHFDISPDGHAAIASRSQHVVFLASLDKASLRRTILLEAEPSLVSFQQRGAQIVAGSYAEGNLTMIDAPSGSVIVCLPIAVRPRYFRNADEGTLLVTGDGKDAVVIVYPYQTEVGETILAGRAPAEMAVVRNLLLLTNPDANRVTVLNLDNRKLAAIIDVGREPSEIVITPDNQYALVLNQKSGDLAVIRIAALTARERVRRYKSAPLFDLIPLGAKPVSAAIVSLS